MSLEEREQLRADMVAAIPSWYRPWAHVLFPSLVGVAFAALAIYLIRDLRAWQLATVPVAFLVLNASEWRLHRDLLHKRVRGATLLYDRHTPLHHMVYITDDMAMRSTREYRLVLMPSFAIVGAAIGALPIPAVLALCGLWNVALLFFATAVLYVVAYEQLHLSFHLPPDSFIGRRKIIGMLRRHHATHHSPALMQRWNFNVVVPLWDLIRGTIYRPERPAARPREAEAAEAR
jgi:Fatty acid hydroxylase